MAENHSHAFVIVVTHDGPSMASLVKCSGCEEERYFRITTRQQALKEFRQRGIEVPDEEVKAYT